MLYRPDIIQNFAAGHGLPEFWTDIDMFGPDVDLTESKDGTDSDETDGDADGGQPTNEPYRVDEADEPKRFV